MDAIGVFRRAVARGPEQTFAFDHEGSVSYAEADERSDVVAAALVDRGIAPGDTLGLCAPDSVALLLAILGSWKAGILPGLIDPRTPDDDLAYFVDDVGAKLVLAPSRLHDRLIAGGAIEVEDLRSFGAAAGHGIDQHGPDAPLYLSYTSGTTGAPKGAILRSGPVTLGTACIADRLGLSREDVLLATTPISSSFQLVAGLLPAIHVGATIGLMAGGTTDEIWEKARTRSAIVLVAYPLTLADMVNAPQAAEAGSPFRLALSGGSPLAPRIKRDYRERFCIPLLESYGQSELGGFMALGSPDDGHRALAGFVGRPLPDRLAYVAGSDGNELPAGEVGEVVVPWGYFDSYRNKPEATANALEGGILHSGDLGIADADGYLKVLGRTREAEAAKARGGFLRELEDAFYEHPDVKHAAVVECMDGEVEGFVELRAGGASTADELSEFASAGVPGGLRPRKTTLLETMPRTFSGKANRLALSQGCGG